MGRVIQLHDEGHAEIKAILPWYVTGRLSPAEQAKVEAHLADCAECQEALAFERRLAQGVANADLAAEAGWRRMASRLEAEPRQRAGARNPVSAPWLGWAAAAAVLVAAVGVSLAPRLQPRAASYHVLGSAPAAPLGNVVVIFRPETSERDMRGALNRIGARVVDGPTGADAYVLQAPEASRKASVDKLRAMPIVVLAEPIDGSGQ